MMTAMTPPISIQIALSVGDPVKNLDTSELKESVALNPTTLSNTNQTRMSVATRLVIKDFQLVCDLL
jgi:hypothetical protein